MDKIRILRSSRRNPKPAKGKATTVTLAPVTTTAAQNQWVPFVVLDLGQKVSPNNAVNSNTAHTANVTIANLIPISVAKPVSSSIPIVSSTVSGPLSTKISQTPTTCVTANNNAAVTQSLPKKHNSSPKKKASTPETCTITIVRNSPRKIRSRPNIIKNNKLLADVSVSKECTTEPSKMVVSVQSKASPANIITTSKQHERVSIKVPVFIQTKVTSANGPVLTQLSSGTTTTTASCNTQISSPIEAPTAVVVTDNEANPNLSIAKESEIYSNVTNLAPICCVICNLPFPTLTEMQAHYLSEHKNRRSRDAKRRIVESKSPEPQKTANLVPIQPKRSIGNLNDEQELNIYVDKSDPKCPVCSISFKTVSEVKDHVKLVHSYRCSECNCTFYTLFEFTCHKCNKGGKKLRVIKKKSNQGKGGNDFVHILPKGKIAISSTSAIQENTVQKNPSQASISQSIPTSQSASNKTEAPLKLKTVREKKKTELTKDNIIEDKDNIPPPLLSHAEEPNPGPVNLHPAYLKDSGKLVKQTEADCNEKDDVAKLAELSVITDKISPPSESSECQKKSPNVVRVLETKNLHCFKIKKDESFPQLKSLNPNTIKEKIDQLKKNPHLSVSWIPKLRIKNEEEGDFVCGRCNVLCDDMDDYMDHIQDCLTITSVTLERTSKPAQRILRLQKEASSFGFQESNNKRYTINKNLMTKLRSVFPEIVEHNSMDLNHNPSKRNGIPSLDSLNHVYQSYTEGDQYCQDHIGAKDLPNEAVEKMCPQPQAVSVKEEPLDDYLEDDPLSCSLDNSLESIGLSHITNVRTVGLGKGIQPMVMIPVAANGAESGFIKAGHYREETTEASIKAEDVREMTTPPNSSPNSASWESSSLDLLIDTDDIKMEVEEEVIEDHYEDQL